MASYEAGLAATFGIGKDVVSANSREVPVSLRRILHDTASVVSRRVMWTMEGLALAGLLFCIHLLTAARQGPEAAALGIAAIYFSGSAGLGAYLLRIDLPKIRTRR